MYVCLFVFLFFYFEYVLLVVCFLVLYVGSRVVLDGSSLFFMLLFLSFWGSGFLGRVFYYLVGLGSFFYLKSSEVVLLNFGFCDYKLYGGCCLGGCGYWVFSG